MKNKLLGIVAVVLLLLQVAVIIVSWLVSAAMPDVPIHSLLSSEGIRWFFGTFVDNLLTPLLVWLLLLSMAWSTVSKSRLLSSWNDRTVSTGRRMALRTSLAVALMLVAVVALLTAVPNAILLSATGELFPSSFSRSIVPVACFIVTVTAMVYGFLLGTISSLSDFYEALSGGAKFFAGLLPIYVSGCELVASLMFVMG